MASKLPTPALSEACAASVNVHQRQMVEAEGERRVGVFRGARHSAHQDQALHRALLSPCWMAWCAQVTVVPEVSRISVLRQPGEVPGIERDDARTAAMRRAWIASDHVAGKIA